MYQDRLSDIINEFAIKKSHKQNTVTESSILLMF